MGKVISILVVIVLGLGAGYYFFVADKAERKAVRKAGFDLKHQAKKAVDAVSVDPKVLHDPKIAAQCRENIRNIEMAKRRVAEKRGVVIGEVPVDEVIKELGGTLPVCGAHGKYKIHAVGTMVRCSVGANGTRDETDDHLLINW